MTEATDTDNPKSKKKQYLHIFLSGNQVRKVLSSSKKDINHGDELEVKEYDRMICKIIWGNNFSGKPEDKIKDEALYFILHVACRFYRVTFDDRLAFYNPRQSNKRYDFVKEEALLWQKTYKMLQALNSLDGKYILNREEYWCDAFFALIKEKQLLLTTISEYVKDEGTKTKLCQKIQSQNRELQYLNTPFLPDTATCSIMKDVMIEYEKNQTLKKEFYNPMIDARMALVQSIINNRTASINYLGRRHVEQRGKKTSK